MDIVKGLRRRTGSNIVIRDAGRVIGLAIAVPNGYRFFASDRRWWAIDGYIYRNFGLLRHAVSIARAEPASPAQPAPLERAA